MNEEQLIIKDALEFIRAAGETGVLKSKLFDAVRNVDSTPLTFEQRDFIFALLEKRGWIVAHLEPLWHNRRYTLTERGLTALEAM